MRRKQTNQSSGYILILVIIALALAGILVGAALMRQSTQSRIIYDTQQRTKDLYVAESGIHKTVAWLRGNSQKLIWPFRRDNFYNLLSRVNPGFGENDTTIFKVPSEIRVNPTNSTAILTSDLGLAKPIFPYTADIISNSVFDAVSEFQKIDVGEAKVRVTLLETVAINSNKDYGPSSQATPGTDFYPVYRIDSMSALNQGAHVYATVVGEPVYRSNVGIYGEDYLELRQSCDSYKSSEGPYFAGRRRANCAAGSNATVAVHQNEAVYGTLKTNGRIEDHHPYGGKVCADFVRGCPNKGETCVGKDCGVPGFDKYYAWNVYCPQSKRSVTVSDDTTWTIAHNTPLERCWDEVKVDSKTTLTLKTTGIPYFFKKLDLDKHSSVINFAPNPSDQTIEIYVFDISGDKVDGDQIINQYGRPRNITIHYLGSSELELVGNSDIRATVISPNAQVTVSGNFDYSGSLLAKRLRFSGNGGIHYDEDLNTSGSITEMKYRIKDWVQYYR